MKQVNVCVAGLLVVSLFASEQVFAECGIGGAYTPPSRTANSKSSQQPDISAVHQSLPLGTRLVVRNQKKGRSIVVRIIDHGLFAFGHIIDLSAGAMHALGMETPAPVCTEVLTYGSEARGYSWVNSGRRYHAELRIITRLAHSDHRPKHVTGMRHGNGKHYARIQRRGHRYAKTRGFTRLAYGGHRRWYRASVSHGKGKRYAQVHRRGHQARRSSHRRLAA
ncbi:MAG: RlpA-like double-psi beta-barrel domain-containing protein [Rhodomicrobium sp.]